MFEALDAAALNSIRSFVGPATARLVGWLREPYGVWAVVSFMLTALRVGLGQTQVKDVFVGLFRIAFVASFALNPATYDGQIAKTLRGMGPGLIQTVSPNSDAGSTPRVVDRALNDTYSTASKFRQLGRDALFVDSAGWYICAGIVIAVAVLVCGVTGFLLLSAQSSLEVMIIVGPLFLWAALYGPTRQMFGAWLGQALGYVLTMLLVSITVVLTFVIWNEAILNTGRNAHMEMAAVVEVGFVGAVCLGMVIASAASASQLTQGVQIASAGVAAAMHRGALRTAGFLKDKLDNLRPRNLERKFGRLRQDADAIKRAGAWVARAF